LFVDGQCFECTGPTAALAGQLCARERLTIDPALLESKDAVQLLLTLCNQGSLAFDEDD
jgi:50S ribosomal protein L16 3-hydroxylase